ncbi:carboxylesterase [Penicillium macrosclerotiorum]|uniref:carboxylesterase n=1 Tax=Penicillium macrosclerotiorum TaxID=303699 RepID=UPI0025488B3E|nr:carboxylesterase [Penicillium macrosclerotiorum]KAJ5698415.1 carboxylesterase [Penicillium macrosclerotiorum]
MGQSRVTQPSIVPTLEFLSLLPLAAGSTLDAHNWGNICPSATTAADGFTIDEDCLNLNIWSPANSTDAKLPVVIWSYPAELTAADPLFYGGGMADKGIVFVNYNYRTGPFGWLAHSKLSAEFEKVTGSNSSGNWAEAREMTMEELIDGVTGSSKATMIMFEAVLDYYAMPDTYLNILKKGLAHDVSVITGNNKNENGATYGHDISLEEYYENVNETYSGVWVERFLELYPANDSTAASGAYHSMFTDRSRNAGAYYESEINYVLNNLYSTDKPWKAEDYEIAEKMKDYWANFIKTGNPNGADTTFEWPAVSSTKKTVQHVGNEWGQIPIAWSKKVTLFKEWFATLIAY